MRALKSSGTGWIASATLNSLPCRSFEHTFRLHKVGTVDHPAADRKHARVWMCFKCGDYFLRVAVFFTRRCERRIDHRDLRGMDCQLAREAFAARRFGFGTQAIAVAEV